MRIEVPMVHGCRTRRTTLEAAEPFRALKPVLEGVGLEREEQP
ncbi:MAG: hypothetical protein ACT4TC_14975 [Myxococcaceae bacterium]